MIIDFHAHVGDFRTSRDDDREVLTWERLLALMDAEGIDKAVHLPVYNASPEGAPLGFISGKGMSVYDQVVDAARYADRIIPFANMDPRWGGNSPRTDFGPLLDFFQEHGCRGVGEVTANIPYDDPRTINMFKQLGARGMMVTIESTNMLPGHYGFQDDPGAPRFERLLQAAPETIVIGHGPGFWAEMGPVASPQEKGGYPNSCFTEEGSLPRHFRKYPNLYADLSAGSGFNALTRNPDHGVQFLNEFQDRLLFGADAVSADLRDRAAQLARIEEMLDALFTDATPRSSASLRSTGRARFQALYRTLTCWRTGIMPQLYYLRRLVKLGKISQQVYEKITWGNGMRLLKKS